MKYIVNNHTYEGLAGETCDWAWNYEEYKTALDSYNDQKSKCDYLDSFVQLFAVEGNNIKLLRAYYGERNGEQNTHDQNNFTDGEYIRQERVCEEGKYYYVDYDKMEEYK